MGKSAESILQEIETESEQTKEQKEKRKQGNKNFYQKWWFWVILLIMICVIGFGLLVAVALLNMGDIYDLTSDIKKIYQDANLYSSVDDSTLMLEWHNFDSEKNKNEMNTIINKIKTSLSDGDLNGYNKLIEIAYLNSGDKQEVLLTKTVYTLPDFNIESNDEYILFSEYKSLNNALIQTTDSFTGLYNSINSIINN